MQLKGALSAGLQKPKPLLASCFEQSAEGRIILFQLMNLSLNLTTRLVIMAAVIEPAAPIRFVDSLPLWKDSLQIRSIQVADAKPLKPGRVNHAQTGALLNLRLVDPTDSRRVSS